MRVLYKVVTLCGVLAVKIHNLQSHWPLGSHHDEELVTFHDPHNRIQRVKKHSTLSDDPHEHELNRQNFYLNLLAEAEELRDHQQQLLSNHKHHLNHHKKQHHTKQHHTAKSSQSFKSATSAKSARFREAASRLQHKQVPACIPYQAAVEACKGVSEAGEKVLDTMIENKFKEEKKRAETEEDRLQKLLNKEIKEKKYNGAALAQSNKAQATTLGERAALIGSDHVAKLENAQVSFALNMRRVQEVLQVYMHYVGAGTNQVVLELGGGTAEAKDDLVWS